MNEDLKSVISQLSKEICSLTDSHKQLRQDVQNSCKVSTEIAKYFSIYLTKLQRLKRECRALTVRKKQKTL